MSLCNRWHKNLKWHRGDATERFCVFKSNTQNIPACPCTIEERKHNTSNTNQPVCFLLFFFFFCSAESMILWLSYGSKTFHAPLSAFARTRPNEIMGNEIYLDESPGLHSQSHDSGIQMSCWNIDCEDVAARRANLPNICSQIFQQRLCHNRSWSLASGGGAARKASIWTCVFLIGLRPNLINCENVVGWDGTTIGASPTRRSGSH